MNNDFDPFTVILLIAAVGIMWKLKSVLGTKTGFERKPDAEASWRPSDKPETPSAAPPTAVAADPDDESAPPVWHGYAKPDTPMAASLDAMAKADSEFSVKRFLIGAKQAYEMIIEAYAKGDKATLKPLLTAETFTGFANEIDRRSQAGEKVSLQFVGINQADLHDARIDGKIATISLRFASEMISATADKTGAILSGDAKNVRSIVDIWSFERDLNSRNPNWKLAATDDPFE